MLFIHSPSLNLRWLILILLSLLLMSVDYYTHALTKVRSVLLIAVAPIQYLVDWPIHIYDILYQDLATQDSLIKQNSALRNKQLRLKADLQRLLALQQENAELRQLLRMVPNNQNVQWLGAEVLLVTANKVSQQLILNRGSLAGVKPGQVVIDANGIMGQVIEISPLTSRILLINDSKSAVPVQDARNGLRGIVIGKGRMESLHLIHIPETLDVQVGDVLLTSGLGERYPAGYPVGIIHKITHRPGEYFVSISVKPLAQLNRSQHVLLIGKKYNNAN